MSLESLIIRGFEGHKRLRVKFDPHVTTIVGPTDAGKSAILRALTWVMTNRPLGESFIHHGADRASVTLRVDGRKIRRVRGGSTNTYSLDSTTHATFGSDVPDDIKQVLNIGEISVQPQAEAPGFWLARSPGEIARQLNSIVDLSVIDRTLGSLAGHLRTALSEERLIQVRIDAALEERKRLAYAKRMNMALQRVEALAEEQAQRGATRARLALLVEQAQRNQERFERLSAMADACARVLSTGEQAEEQRQRAKRLSDLIELMPELEARASRSVPDLEHLERLHRDMLHTQQRADELAKLAKSMGQCQTKMLDVCIALGEARKRLEKVEVCPTCGQQIR